MQQKKLRMKGLGRLYYIEPSAVCFSGDIDNEDSISKFLDAFEEMQSALAVRKEHIVIDKVLAERIMPMTGEGLVPVDISQITKEDIRGRVLRLKQSFYSIINPLTRLIDTEVCSSMQDIFIASDENKQLLESRDYFDFIHSLVGECYRADDMQSRSILVIPMYTKICGGNIQLSCKCEKSEFDKVFCCCSVHNLADPKEKLKQEIGQALKKISVKKKGEIKVTQAAHNPVIGNTIIDKFVEIPSRLRRVLDILANFGLSEIELRDWGSHAGKKGNIVNCVLMQDKADGGKQIIEGWLIIEDRSCKVVMYFEKEMGKLLLNYLGKKWEYNNVIQLWEHFM